MLIQFNSFLQGIFGKIIILMIIATLSVFGFGAFTAFTNTDEIVAVVNGDDISERTLRSRVTQRRQQMALEDNADDLLALADSPDFSDQILNLLINQKLLEQAADDFGFVASEFAVDSSIRSAPNFQIEGEYEPDLLLEVLQTNSGNVSEYRSQLARSLLRTQLQLGISGTEFVTDIEFERALSLVGETRDVAWLPLKLEALAKDIEVTDEEIEDYYQSFISDYELSERVVVEYLELNESQMAEQMDISEEDILAIYEAEKSEFVSKEERLASHILLRKNDERSDEEAMVVAMDLYDQLLAGADFAELAKEHSEDNVAERGGDLGWAPRGRYVPPFDAALFALEEGGISEPVATNFGVHIIKFYEARGAEFATLEEAEGRIKNDLAKARAADQFSEQSLQLAEISYESSDLQSASEALSLPIEISSPFASSEAEGLFAEPSVLAAIFSDDVLEQNYNSALLEPEEGVALVLRLLEKQPARQQTLEEVKDKIVDSLSKEQALQNARLLADAAMKRLLDGDNKAEIANDLDVAWVKHPGILRNDGTLEKDLVMAAFDLKEPGKGESALDKVETDEGVFLVTVTSTTMGNTAIVADDRKTAERNGLSSQTGTIGLNIVQNALAKRANIDKQ